LPCEIARDHQAGSKRSVAAPPITFDVPAERGSATVLLPARFRVIADCGKFAGCYRARDEMSFGGEVHAYPMARHRIDASSAAVGIPAAAYLIVLGLSALWFYSLLQPRYIPNPGLAVFKPPPATVMGDEMPARLLARYGQAPPLAEIESPPEGPDPPEEPATTVVESKPERIIRVKEPRRPQAHTPRWERGNPLGHYAAAYPGYSGNRPF
jgi:hypothetical protein